MTNLTDSLAARADARSRHQADVEALARGRERLGSAQSELERLAAVDTESVARHARRLEQQTREGKSGPVPTLVPSDKHLSAQIAATRTLEAAKQMVASLEASERKSRAALVAAEAAHRNAGLAILAAEGDVLAQQIINRDAETEAMRRQLQGLRELVTPTPLVRRAAPAAGDWINTPIPQLREIEAQASGAARSRLHTPLDRLDAFQVDPAATEHWAERLHALLSGELPPSALEDVA